MRACTFLAFLLLVVSAVGGQFKVYDSVLKTEGKPIDAIMLLTDKHQYLMVPPAGYIRRVDEENTRIIFEARGGQANITLQFTTNSPSALPDEGLLRTNITKLYPGAEIVSSGSSRAQIRPSLYFELKKKGDALSLMTYHTYIPTADGLVELKISANSDDYKKEMLWYRDVLLTFHEEPRTAPR